MTVIAALSLGAVTSIGCSAPLAPQPMSSGTIVVAAVEQLEYGRLLMCEWQGSRSVSREVGPEGGELELGGNRVRVPEGALSRPAVLTLSVPAGQQRIVRFESSGRGVLLERPAEITISHDGCGVQSGDADRTVTVETAAFSTYAVMY